MAMQSFEDLLKARLADPVKDKTGRAIVNNDGTLMTPMEAMVMSVVNSAMKGDIASIAFIRNMTKATDPEAESQHRQRMAQRTDELEAALRSQFQNEGLYDGQDTELRQLAETALLVEQLTEEMRADDFHATLAEYRRDGSTATTVNPLITLRDQQANRFQELIDKMRQDAVKRKLNRERY